MNIGKARAIKARALFAQVASGEYHGSTVGEYLEAVKIVLDMETYNSITKKMIISVCKWLVEIAEKAVSPYRWIPVSERLPEAGQTIIAQCRANIIKTLKLDSNGDWYQDAEHCYMSGFVVAWMPLPEPYKPNK